MNNKNTIHNTITTIMRTIRFTVWVEEDVDAVQEMRKRRSNTGERKKQLPTTTIATIYKKKFRRNNKRHSTKMVGPNKSHSDRRNGIDNANVIKRPNRRKETRRKLSEEQKQQIKINRQNNNNNNNSSIPGNNKYDIQDRTEQRIFDICKEHFGIIADPRFSVTKT
jgi:hypothetical protein